MRKMSGSDQITEMRASVTLNQTHMRSQEPDSMDAIFQDELLDNHAAEQGEAMASQHSASEVAEEALDDVELTEEEEMTIVDPLIDKAGREVDDSAVDDDLEDSEFEDDLQLDQLDVFMSEDPDKADELLVLDDDAGMGDDDLEPLLSKELEKAPLTASQQALEARRAIEERAESRRMERDLNYLDFELDD